MNHIGIPIMRDNNYDVCDDYIFEAGYFRVEPLPPRSGTQTYLTCFHTCCAGGLPMSHTSRQMEMFNRISQVRDDIGFQKKEQAELKRKQMEYELPNH